MSSEDASLENKVLELQRQDVKKLGCQCKYNNFVLILMLSLQFQNLIFLRIGLGAIFLSAEACIWVKQSYRSHLILSGQ